MYYILTLTVVPRDRLQTKLLNGLKTLFLNASRLSGERLVFTYIAEDKIISPLPILNTLSKKNK